jgi:hypothetical protein
MPATLIPNKEIPGLAAQIDSPAVLSMLRHLQKAGLVLNGEDIDKGVTAILQRLTELDLVDVGYAGTETDRPSLWTINGNGLRVLRHIETSPLQANLEPRFKIHPRARPALATLSDWEQTKVLLAVEALQNSSQKSWSSEDVVPLGDSRHLYLLRIAPDLRAFIKVPDSGEIELFDIVREETLQFFLERLRATSAHS